MAAPHAWGAAWAADPQMRQIKTYILPEHPRPTRGAGNCRRRCRRNSEPMSGANTQYYQSALGPWCGPPLRTGGSIMSGRHGGVAPAGSRMQPNILVETFRMRFVVSAPLRRAWFCRHLPLYACRSLHILSLLFANEVCHPYFLLRSAFHFALRTVFEAEVCQPYSLLRSAIHLVLRSVFHFALRAVFEAEVCQPYSLLRSVFHLVLRSVFHFLRCVLYLKPRFASNISCFCCGWCCVSCFWL